MISFDELFAYRIYYQDVSFDEFYIIKKLKQLLIDDGMEEDEVNDHLFNFYTHFGHTISLEEIKSVNITPVVPSNQNSLLTSFFNFINNYNQNVPEEEPIIENEPQDENNDNPIDEHNDNPNDLSEDTIEQDNLTEEDDHLDNLNELPNLEIPNLLNLPNLEIPINNDNYPQTNLNFGMMPPTLNINNTEILFTPINNNNSGSSIVFEYSNLVDNNNLLGQLMNQIINTTNLNQPQEDINVTMDKEDINNLEILRYNEEEDSNCSICLMDVVKDDYYYKINCGHFFHRKCLEKWLEEYNYVCPVCRKELGKSKAHIDSGDSSTRTSSSSEGDFV